ncbi:MAG: hypothetical protein ACR2NA_04700 [Solirubrobacterales bacterium]
MEASSDPVLALDVDGVISLFGFESPSGEPPGKLIQVDGTPHCIALDTGPRIRRLGEYYQLIWASGWEERANDHLPFVLDINKLPYLSFGGSARWGTAHWKLEQLESFAAGRPLAWVDDSLDQSCFAWARQRTDPTLLVPTESPIGLVDTHVDTLIRWVRDGYTHSR